MAEGGAIMLWLADKICGSDWGGLIASSFPSSRTEIICGGVQKILATSIHNTDFAQRCISNYLLLSANNHVRSWVLLPAWRRFIETTHPYPRLSLPGTGYTVGTWIAHPHHLFLITDSRSLHRMTDHQRHRIALSACLSTDYSPLAESVTPLRDNVAC